MAKKKSRSEAHPNDIRAQLLAYRALNQELENSLRSGLPANLFSIRNIVASDSDGSLRPDPEKNEHPLVDCQDCVSWGQCGFMDGYDSHKPKYCSYFESKKNKKEKEPEKPKTPDFPKEVPRGRLLDDDD